jgi:uncharacterized cysteine cluster protein YcgN (CxxCxxCC family)
MGELRERFWELPLGELNRPEWEALCDGCGRCCLHKIEDADTGEILDTNIACRLLDTGTAQCSDYRNRKAFVPDCLRLTPTACAQMVAHCRADITLLAETGKRCAAQAFQSSGGW